MAPGRFLVVVSILLSCTTPSLQYRSCGSGGFEIYQGRCYYFSSSSTNWDGAQSTCKGKKANLASLHSEEESSYVTRKMDPLTYRGFWIGLRKYNKAESPLAKNYKWIDGSTKDYSKWNSGEPNDGGGGNEDCVEQFAPQGTWNDIRCYNSYPFVCTKDYGEGWQEYNNYQYYVSFMPEQIESTWYEARDWCMENGGDLASVLSDDEVTQVAGWASSNDFKGDLWIGLNKLAGNRDAWGWSDGSAYSNENWAPRYPADGKYGNLCGYQASEDTTGKWKNSHCDTTKGFICKRVKAVTPTPKTPPTTPVIGGYCPAGYTGVGNKCFKVVFPGKKNVGALTFEQALVTCGQEPGIRPTLASIESELDQAFVDAQLQELRLGVYIGLRRTTFGEDWKWVDSSPYKYQHWGPNQPDRSDEHCVEIWMLPGTLGMWNNIKCGDKRGYVCQTYKDADNIINTSPSPTGSFSCPDGYTQYWYACYKFEAKAYSYDQALSECQKDKATLVGIHAEAENAAIQTMAITNNTDLWLGFRDRNNSDVGEYKWEDGWNVLFTLWASGQPTKQPRGGCVKMSPDGRWRDDVCDKQMPSICKISSVPPYTTPATLPGRCPSGDSWFEYAEHCYHISESTTQWETAKTECQHKAFLSTLASIHSHAENQMIYNKINQISNYNKNVWIGLYRSQKDRTKMMWTDGGALQYENWADGEPNGGEDDSEDCVEMWNDQWPTQWNDHSCTDYKKYVCKAPKIPHISIPTPSPHCAPGWKFGFGHCYFFQPDTWLPFGVAKSTCEGLGANLASVHGFLENYYIEEEIKLSSTQPLQRPSFWIGMQGKPLEGDIDGWKGEWLDGTEVDFTHWEQDPPAWTKDDKCVSADTTKGRWKPVNCGKHFGFACRRPSNYTDGGDGKTTTDGTGGKTTTDGTDGKTTKDPGGEGNPAGGGMSGGAVAGAVIGSILGAIVIAFIVVVVLMKIGVIDNRLPSIGQPNVPYQSHKTDLENNSST